MTLLVQKPWFDNHCDSPPWLHIRITWDGGWAIVPCPTPDPWNQNLQGVVCSISHPQKLSHFHTITISLLHYSPPKNWGLWDFYGHVHFLEMHLANRRNSTTDYWKIKKEIWWVNVAGKITLQKYSKHVPTPEIEVKDLPESKADSIWVYFCFLWKCYRGLNIQDYNHTGKLNTQTKDHTIKGIQSHTGISEHLDWHKIHGGLNQMCMSCTDLN